MNGKKQKRKEPHMISIQGMLIQKIASGYYTEFGREGSGIILQTSFVRIP